MIIIPAKFGPNSTSSLGNYVMSFGAIVQDTRRTTHDARLTTDIGQPTLTINKAITQ